MISDRLASAHPSAVRQLKQGEGEMEMSGAVNCISDSRALSPYKERVLVSATYACQQQQEGPLHFPILSRKSPHPSHEIFDTFNGRTNDKCS